MDSDLKLLAIAGPPCLHSDTIVEACQAAEAGGVTAIQARLKDAGAAQLLDVTRRLIETLSIPVYVNDRADVALAAGARGVHVGADDIPVQAVRRLAPRPFRIGVSVGDGDEANTALQADVDYWSIGSIYATGSKADAGRPIGVGGFERLAANAPKGMPVIAIGGIDCTNAAAVIHAGAHGVAVISAVFGASDVEQAARDLRAVVEESLSR